MNKINITQFENIKLSIGCGFKNEVLAGKVRDVNEKENDKAEEINQPNLKEFIGLDSRDLGQEIVWDLSKGIPLPNNSCIYVWASHILEHFGAYQIVEVMDEIWRVLKKDGILEIRAPITGSSTAYLPQHQTQFTKDYFSWFTSPNLDTYGNKQWEITKSLVYHRKGAKFDLQVIMKPVKEKKSN